MLGVDLAYSDSRTTINRSKPITGFTKLEKYNVKKILRRTRNKKYYAKKYYDRSYDPKLTLTFRPGNYTRRFSYGFEVVVKDLGEWRPGFYSEFRCASHEHSGLLWGAIFEKNA